MTATFIYPRWGCNPGCHGPAAPQVWNLRLYGMPALQVAAVVLLALVLGVSTSLQDRYWANDMRLYARGVECTPQNKLARTNLGNALGETGIMSRLWLFIIRYWSRTLTSGWRSITPGTPATGWDAWTKPRSISSARLP